LVRHRELRTLALLTAAGNVSVASGMATLVLFATDRHGLGVTTAAYGVLLATMAVGGIVGGLIAGRVAGRLGGRLTVIVGLAIEAAGWFALAFTRNALVAGLLLAALWVSFSVLSVVIMGIAVAVRGLQSA
jgi:predicted MFS family arabinose efflux permease